MCWMLMPLGWGEGFFHLCYLGVQSFCYMRVIFFSSVQCAITLLLTLCIKRARNSYFWSFLIFFKFLTDHIVWKWKWMTKNWASSNSTSQGFYELPQCQNKKFFFSIIGLSVLGSRWTGPKKSVKICIFYSYPSFPKWVIVIFPLKMV